MFVQNLNIVDIYTLSSYS